jgi:excisionase family DNA binding protein
MDIPARSASNPAAGSDLVTVAEAARVMRVSKMTVYRLIHATELPAMRIGRSFRIDRRDLTEYLDLARR